MRWTHLFKKQILLLILLNTPQIFAQANLGFYESTKFVVPFVGLVGGPGYRDGLAISQSLFSHPSGVVKDSVGNNYVADTGNNVIRKISTAGFVSTLAGVPSSSGSFSDGTGSNAFFNTPVGLAIDSSSNMYVADELNNCIRMISSTGVVTTIAGNGAPGAMNGTALNATFYDPKGVAIDSSGNIYVADTFNHLIRKISNVGVVTTLAGSGTAGSANGSGTLASFNTPTGLVVDPAGNIFVADFRNSKIRKITSAGVVTTLAGSGSLGSANGSGIAASFNYPTAISIDGSSNLYVIDSSNNLIRKITSTGLVSTIAGTTAPGSLNGTGTAATFNTYNSMNGGLFIDASNNIYVADSGNNLIRNISNTLNVTTFAGLGAMGALNGTGSSATFNNPQGLASDSLNNIYVADANNNLIRKVTSSGIVTTFAGSGSMGAVNGSGTMASFASPQGLAIDSSGNIYVADMTNNLIRKITAGGMVSTFAGSGTMGTANGTGASASFNQPMALAVDSASNVYVADYANQSIRKITAGGAVTTLAGLPGVPGAIDGVGTAARFNSPSGIATDTIGNLYVADSGNNMIRRVSSTTGQVTTIAGTFSSYVDGPGAQAAFNNPTSIAIDATGNLYVTDNFNNLIRKVTTPGYWVSTVAGIPWVPYPSPLFGPLPSNVGNLGGIVVNATGLYFVESNGIAKVPSPVP